MKTAYLVEEILKQSVEGTVWVFLLLMVKCERKEIHWGETEIGKDDFGNL